MKKVLTTTSLFILLFSTIMPSTVMAQIVEDHQGEKSNIDSVPSAVDSSTNEMVDDAYQPVIEEVEYLAEVTQKNALIYSDNFDQEEAREINETLYNETYFVSKKAEFGKETFYLLEQATATERVPVGWLHESDIERYSFEKANSNEQTVYLVDGGKVYTKFADEETVSTRNPADAQVQVITALSIDGTLWYYGLVEDDDKPVWIEAIDTLTELQEEEDESSAEAESEEPDEAEQSSTNSESTSLVEEQEEVKDTDESVAVKQSENDDQALEELEDDIDKFQMLGTVKSTSRLGHIRGGTRKIYKDYKNTSTAFNTTSAHTNAVYYIKQQVSYGGELFYKISTEPSASKGVIGWMKAKDLSTHPHVGVDRKAKKFLIKGTGKAFLKAWGGSKDHVYNLSNFKGQTFNVHLTEKVGNNIWYRGTLGGKTVWMHSSYVEEPKLTVSKTSRLGHIRSESRKIYKDLRDESTAFNAGSTYTHAVYYIKEQADYANETYYKISNNASATSGVVGWVNAKDLSTHPHVGVDKYAKRFIIKGSGKAFSKAWGGSKDHVYNLSNYKGQIFNVHLTEKVGNNIWYRGTLDGKTVWMHSSYVEAPKVSISSTSRLGHIRSESRKIYKEIGNEATAFRAGSTYTHAVYYIKEQASYANETYYKISNNASATSGVVGWVNAKDLSTHPHVGVDRQVKNLYINASGKGDAYTKAWGGSKDHVYRLASYKGQAFRVNLTEKVGNNVWYRGTLGGKTVWVHNSYVDTNQQVGSGKDVVRVNQNQGITLKEMVERQMKVNPQTDRHMLWIREDGLNIRSGSSTATVKGNNWRLRDGPGTSYAQHATVNNGDTFVIQGSKRNSQGELWYYTYRKTGGWTKALKGNVEYFLDPSNFLGTLTTQLQFLDLSSNGGLSITQLNNEVLKGKGILNGKAAAFVQAGKEHGLNEIYLISHSLLETGQGTSSLATGVKHNGKTVYNMYGIGAYDSCALECGAKRAYDEGWFTPEAAIIGGAKFVSTNYVNRGQNTLYNMRWQTSASHQYATDIGWATKQTSQMASIYSKLTSYTMKLIIPKYK